MTTEKGSRKTMHKEGRQVNFLDLWFSACFSIREEIAVDTSELELLWEEFYVSNKGGYNVSLSGSASQMECEGKWNAKPDGDLSSIQVWTYPLGATQSPHTFCLLCFDLWVCVLMIQCMGDMLHICKQSDKSNLLLFTSLFTKHQACLPCITN